MSRRITSKPVKDILSILRYVVFLTVILLVVFFRPYTFFTQYSFEKVFKTFTLLSFDTLFKSEKRIVLTGAPAFKQFLADQEATLEQIRNGSRALDFHSLNLPKDLEHQLPQERMSQFTSLVLSHALKNNEKILKKREQLIRFLEDSQRNLWIDDKRKSWYRNLAKDYALPKANPQELLKRVDIVPVSLTIAQAITESGWGTSRFAQQGNALYGQHLPKSGRGKFITSRYGGVKVAAFDSILQSTASYMHTINTSRAYSSLREMRHKLRQQGKIPDGYTLAAGLRHYSEIGEQYVTDIRHLIDTYQLEELERARLNKERPVGTIRFIR